MDTATTAPDNHTIRPRSIADQLVAGADIFSVRVADNAPAPALPSDDGKEAFDLAAAAAANVSGAFNGCCSAASVDGARLASDGCGRVPTTGLGSDRDPASGCGSI